LYNALPGGIVDNNGHKGCTVAEERRGKDPASMSDSEWREYMERRMNRVESVLFGFVGVFKEAFGRLWSWMDKNVRGGDHEN
jgi:hypothetical protein